VIDVDSVELGFYQGRLKPDKPGQGVTRMGVEQGL
jgi:hypothetical protein